MEEIVLVAEDESRGPPRMQSVGPGIRVGRERARYDIFFTDRRIIAAVIFSTAELSKWDVAAAFQAMHKWLKLKNERRAQFKGKMPEEILHLHPESFELPYDRIQSVKVKKKLVGAKLEVEIEGEEKIDLPIPKSKLREIELVLRQYLPGKVK
ncbi:MAG: PH domain-containing protein [Methanophagales archaeon]|nr:PH domain-containing protein [Methanophagales archaeon]